MRQRLGVSVLILAPAAINTSVQRMNHAVRSARSPDSVTVLLGPPQRPYTVIAVIESNSETVFDRFDDLRKAMVAETASAT